MLLHVLSNARTGNKLFTVLLFALLWALLAAGGGGGGDCFILLQMSSAHDRSL
jgi:hypothetical protein